MGNLSDLHGRKPILLISQAGTLFSWFIFAGAWVIGEQYGWISLSLIIIGFARITDGITGGNSTVANAYLSDILSPDKRGASFGYVGAITGLGIIVGPAIGALTSASSIGYLGMVIFSISLSTITLLAIFTMLKESLPAHEREGHQKEIKEDRASTEYSFLKRKIFKDLNIFNSIKTFKENETVISVFVVKLFISLVLAANSTTIMLLLIDRFNFNQQEVGFFLLVVGGFLMFNQIFLVKLFINKFGEPLTLLLALIFTGVGLFIFPILENLILFIVFYYITNLGISLAFPTIRAIASREASKKQQGKVMGIDESIFSISMAVMPFVAATLYNWINWKAFLAWGSISLVGAVYYLIKNRQRIQVHPKK